MVAWGTTGDSTEIQVFSLAARYSDNGLLRWSSICLALDLSLCWVKYWIDGRKVADEALVATWASLCNGSQPAWPTAVSHMKSGQNLVGDLTNLQLHSSLLSDNVMEAITLCRQQREGDLISWAAGAFSLVGNVTRLADIVDYGQVCPPTQPWQRIIPVPMDYHQATSTCKKLGASLGVVRDSGENSQLAALMATQLAASPQVEGKCSHYEMLGGIQYGPSLLLAQHKGKGPVEESPVRDPYTGQDVTFTNWFPGWPDANYVDKGNYWHVWVYKAGETGMITEWGTVPICFSCRGATNQLQLLRLRGLCRESQFDRTYILAATREEPLFFQGDRHTNLTYSQARGGWLLTAVRSSKGQPAPLLPPVTAFSEAPLASLAFGKHKFQFESDYNCRKEPGFSLTLLLTSCTDQQFTCRDGLCLPLTSRCNQVPCTSNTS